MKRGCHTAAWAISDIVLGRRDPATRDDPALPYHRRWVWDGRPFLRRHVLVRCYHGLGDTLQFARYLPVLRRLVASLTVEVQPALLPLLTTIVGPDRLVPFDPAKPLPPSECDIEIMELAHALRLLPDAVPPGYLRAAPAPLPAGAIGLCWRAGDWDPLRALPPELLAPLSRYPCLTLQPHPTTLRVLNPRGCSTDIADTAALIAGTALVVTVDTMVAHLAGALDHPTCLLLRHDADWRWMQDRSDSPWYPSMRLYRQPAPGDWASVTARLAADLAAVRCRGVG
jgi:hypothetical protein